MKKLIIIAVIVTAAIILSTLLVWADIKARELWSKSPESYVSISDVKSDFYVCGSVGGAVYQGTYRGGWHLYRANVTVTVSNQGYGDIIATVNVTTHWSINTRNYYDCDIKEVFVKAHASNTVIANVSVGINPKFEYHSESIVNVFLPIRGLY